MNPQDQKLSYNTTHSGGHSGILAGVFAFLFVCALVFGGWAFSQMQSYKTQSDQKSAVAVAAAEKTQAAKLQAQFAEQSKSPFKTFNGSPTYGSVSFDYPKTWSAYVDTSQPTEPINGYFYPDTVPSVQSKVAFALRIELVNTDYSQVIQQFSGNIKQGKVTAVAYTPPKLNGLANVQPGTMLSGQVNPSDQTQNDRMLIIKVRDKTLEISSQSPDFYNDFNSTILNSLTFSP